MSTEAPASLYARLHLRQGGFHLDMGMLLRRPGVVALYGPSGCGKSTFLRCLAGLEKHAEGKLQVGRHCLMDSSRDIFVPSHKRRVGLVFQDTRLFPHLDVEANLHFGARHRPSGDADPGFDQAVELFDLGPLLGRRPATLSGGEKQRVAIARSLLTEPRLLLLDEPLSAVDATRKAEILPYLERLFHQAMIPVVLVTHDWQDVLRLSSQVYIMEQGHLKHHGPGIHQEGYRVAIDEAAGNVVALYIALQLHFTHALVVVPPRRFPVGIGAFLQHTAEEEGEQQQEQQHPGTDHHALSQCRGAAHGSWEAKRLPVNPAGPYQRRAAACG